MKKVVTKTGKYLLILFFLYYYIGITAFVHTHQIAAYTVTHSHPFFPWSHHSHSEIEYGTISILNMLVAEVAPALTVFFILSFIGFILQTCRYSAPHREFYHPALRAPPVAVMG